MKKLVAVLALPLLLNACAEFHNADAGQPEVEKASQSSVDSIVQCISDEAKKHEFYDIMLADSDRLMNTIDQVLESARLRSEARQIERYAQRRLTHFVPSEPRWKRAMWILVAIAIACGHSSAIFSSSLYALLFSSRIA